MIGGEAPRPGFADELLARLERDRYTPALSPVLRGALAGAATASMVLLLAGRRRAR